MNIDKVLLLSLLAGYTGKVSVLGASSADAAVVLVLAAAHFLYNSQIQNKEIKALKDEIQAIKVIQAKQASDIEEVKSMASSIKIATGLRPAR